MEADEKVKKALDLIHECAGIAGDHHKDWLVDQLVRVLADDYTEWVGNWCSGVDGPETYYWECGIAP